MTDFILNNIYLTLLLPLWLFLIVMVGRFFSVYVNRLVINVLTLFSSAFGALLCGVALWKIPAETILETQISFIKINDFIISCGLHADRLAFIFALVLFSVSFLVQIFSTYYMRDDAKYYRFFALLNLFNFSMAGLFFSPNLFQTYFFWELVGVVSYFLIGFEYSKEKKSVASKKVFIINRIGDVSLISGIISSAYFVYNYAGNYHLTTLSFVDFNIISTLVYAYTSSPVFLLICGLFIIGIIVKSAQFPFYTWLQDAMEAKLPVSALLHSATMVASGVFLLLRMLPFFTMEMQTLKVIAYIGLLTAIICSISSCSQVEPKKALAYSTSAQLGLIFFAVGILNIKAGIALFVAHAFIKPMLFLTLPEQNKKWNYYDFIAFLLAGLSLSGLILSGMVVKEMVIVGLGQTGITIFSILAFLTAFYIIRIALVVYDNCEIEKTKPSIIKLVAIVGLLVFNILYYIHLHKTAQYKIAEPFWAALLAWILVYVLYTKNWFIKVPLLYQLSYNGFYLDKIYSVLVVNSYKNITKLLNFFELKIFTNYKPLIFLSCLNVKMVSWIETYIMNGAVRIVEDSIKKLSEINSRAQNGNVQRYNAYAFIIITIVLISLNFAYSAIIIFIGG